MNKKRITGIEPGSYTHLDYIQPGDTVLVKASHFRKFEDVVQTLEKL